MKLFPKILVDEEEAADYNVNRANGVALPSAVSFRVEETASLQAVQPRRITKEHSTTSCASSTIADLTSRRQTRYDRPKCGIRDSKGQTRAVCRLHDPK